jgi:hypothetical protein
MADRLPEGFTDGGTEPDDPADLARRVREIETRQRILAAHMARLLGAMEDHNLALEALEKAVGIIVKAMKREQKEEVEA